MVAVLNLALLLLIVVIAYFKFVQRYEVDNDNN
jgi:Tfp pilus assembly protein PilE